MKQPMSALSRTIRYLVFLVIVSLLAGCGKGASTAIPDGAVTSRSTPTAAATSTDAPMPTAQLTATLAASVCICSWAFPGVSGPKLSDVAKIRSLNVWISSGIGIRMLKPSGEKPKKTSSLSIIPRWMFSSETV